MTSLSVSSFVTPLADGRGLGGGRQLFGTVGGNQRGTDVIRLRSRFDSPGRSHRSPYTTSLVYCAKRAGTND